ncbi:hypothetical protein ACRAWF_41205 [Streptomyces sp. L7]
MASRSRDRDFRPRVSELDRSARPGLRRAAREPEFATLLAATVSHRGARPRRRRCARR